jgi:hypothetical protein
LATIGQLPSRVRNPAIILFLPTTLRGERCAARRSEPLSATSPSAVNRQHAGAPPFAHYPRSGCGRAARRVAFFHVLPGDIDMRSMLVLSGFLGAFSLAAAALAPTAAEAGPGLGGGYKSQVKSK